MFVSRITKQFKKDNEVSLTALDSVTIVHGAICQQGKHFKITLYNNIFAFTRIGRFFVHFAFFDKTIIFNVINSRNFHFFFPYFNTIILNYAFFSTISSTIRRLNMNLNFFLNNHGEIDYFSSRTRLSSCRVYNESEHAVHTDRDFRIVLDRGVSVYIILGQHRRTASIAQQLHQDHQRFGRVVNDV